MPDWWNQARVGVFVCWGPYCVPGWAPKGTYAEWYGHNMRDKGSPTQKFHEKTYGNGFKYEQFADSFRAELYDPDAWADLFVKSGAKYVVMSAVYHDGFCTWPSPYQKGWNSVDVGPKRDLLGDMAGATRKKGLIFGIYYSLYEWYNPLWLSDRARYVTEHFHPQFKDVVTRYQPWCVFADGDWEQDSKAWRSDELLAWLFNDSPVKDVVAVNDRWGRVNGQHGSFWESEYGGGRFPPTHPWQEDRGIGASYGYNRNETPAEYDPPDTMMRMLSKTVGNGGNYLICVGPTADGRIDNLQQERLLQMGQWLKKNGEAIYGSKASPFWPRQFTWGTCTYKPGRLFVHVWGKPSEPVVLRDLKNKVVSARWLGGGAVTLKTTPDGPAVVLPECMPDPWVSVAELRIEGKPVVDTTIRQKPDGTVTLHARDALIHGSSPQYEVAGGKDDIGYWGNPADMVSWQFRVDKPGTFEVIATYSCAAGAGGSKFRVTTGDPLYSAQWGVSGTTVETGDWAKFAKFSLGRVKYPRPAIYDLWVAPVTPPKWKSMGLQSIVLRPVRK